MALGITWSLPDEDRHSQTRNELLAMIKRLLAGRIAEEIKFGDVTTGASNNFEKATEISRRMVTQYGMSDTLGPIQYGRGNHQVFLGRDLGEDRNYSEEVASKIDAEVRRIIEDCYNDARQILEAHWDKVERMVGSLLEHETVDTEEVLAILKGTYPPTSIEPPAEPPASGGCENSRTGARAKPVLLPPTITPEPAWFCRARRRRGRARERGPRRLSTAGPPPPPTRRTGRCRRVDHLPARRSAVPDVAAIALWFRAPSAGFESVPAPGLGRLAAGAVAASQPVTGTRSRLHERSADGSRHRYPQSVAVSTLVPADQAQATMRAITRSFFAPV